MDLYEALKAGTTKEELLSTFQKELDSAIDRFEKEEEAALQEEYLADARTELANVILDYIAVLYPDLNGEEIPVSQVISILKDFEKEMENFSSLMSFFKNWKTKKPMEWKFTADIDNDIIKKFLKELY